MMAYPLAYHLMGHKRSSLAEIYFEIQRVTPIKKKYNAELLTP